MPLISEALYYRSISSSDMVTNMFSCMTWLSQIKVFLYRYRMMAIRSIIPKSGYTKHDVIAQPRSGIIVYSQSILLLQSTYVNDQSVM